MIHASNTIRKLNESKRTNHRTRVEGRGKKKEIELRRKWRGWVDLKPKMEWNHLSPDTNDLTNESKNTRQVRVVLSAYPFAMHILLLFCYHHSPVFSLFFLAEWKCHEIIKLQKELTYNGVVYHLPVLFKSLLVGSTDARFQAVVVRKDLDRRPVIVIAGPDYYLQDKAPYLLSF